jgi:GDP-mannose 6-dehydrogenase
MCDTLEAVLAESEVIVVGNKAPEFRQALEQIGPGQVVIDLVRIAQDVHYLPAGYQGICW